MQAVFKDKQISYAELRFVKEVSECTKMHLHDEITITAIKKGSLKIILNDSSFDLNTNEIAIIDAQIPHCATINVKSQDGYVLYLDKSYLLEKHLEFIFDTKLFEDKNIYKNFINLCDCLLDKSINIMEKEENLLLFCSLVFTIQRDKNEVIDESKISYKIKNYLDINYLEELNLEDLAKKFDISVVHLIRVFKNQFGLPIHSYILNKKVHKAKELLTTNMPIINVAQNSGFFDQSHLNRSFKRIFQITPKQFQQSIKC